MVEIIVPMFLQKKRNKNDIKIVIMTIMFYISFRLYDII